MFLMAILTVAALHKKGSSNYIKSLTMKNSVLTPVLRRALMDSTDLEILSTYNAELRGICNFYSFAGNFHRLCYFVYLMEYSCLKTLAAKHRSSIGKIKDKYRNGKNGCGIPYETKTGINRMYFAKFRDCKNTKTFSDVETNAFMMYNSSVTTFESRLKANVCELCNTSSSGHFELHHINKVKNLKGKDFWERVMIAKRRKTLVLCKECHYMVHHH
jgi:hypothetical protein